MRAWIRLTFGLLLVAVAVVSLTPASASAAKLRKKGDCCEPVCVPTMKVELTACDPCCRRCGCDEPVCFTACIPVCCEGAPKVCSDCCGLFGKHGIVTYTWDCGYSVSVHFGLGGRYRITQGY